MTSHILLAGNHAVDTGFTHSHLYDDTSEAYTWMNTYIAYTWQIGITYIVYVWQI